MERRASTDTAETRLPIDMGRHSETAANACLGVYRCYVNGCLAAHDFYNEQQEYLHEWQTVWGIAASEDEQVFVDQIRVGLDFVVVTLVASAWLRALQ